MKIRSFLAIEIPTEIKEILHREAGAPVNLHLTLRFLGEVEEELLTGELSRKVAAVVHPLPPIELSVEGAGLFPDIKRPRVLWIGLRGDLKILAGLHAEIGKILSPFPVHREPPRPFVPHLTVRRVRSERDKKGIEEWVAQHKEGHFGTFVAKEVVLFKSELTRQGARYSKLSVFPFKGE